MSFRTLSLLLLTLFSLFVAGVSRADDKETRRQIKAAYAQRDEAHTRNDPKLILTYLQERTTPDFVMRDVDADRPRQEVEKSARESRGKYFFADLPHLTFSSRTRVRKLEVRGEEAVADVHEQTHIRNVLPNGAKYEVTDNGSYRDTWVKSPEGWKLRLQQQLWWEAHRGAPGSRDAFREAQQDLPRSNVTDAELQAVRREIEALYAREAAQLQGKEGIEAQIAAWRSLRSSDYMSISLPGRVLTREQQEQRLRTIWASRARIRQAVTIRALAVTGDTVVVLIRDVRDRVPVSDRQPGSERIHPDRVTYTRRDTWRKTGDGWRLTRAEQLSMKMEPRHDVKAAGLPYR